MPRSTHVVKKKHSAVPPKASRRQLVDGLTLAAAIIEPIITVPQAWDIFRNHTAAGVSLTTWVGYEALTVIWVWYAIVHKDRILLIYQGLYVIVQTAIIIGILQYGGHW